MAGNLEPEAKESELLELPAELRNRIYRLAINKEKSINVWLSGVPEPGILRSCKQIRHEAITIYCGENTFRLQMRNFNSEICIHWDSKLHSLERKYKIKRINSDICLRGTPNWKNIRIWLQRMHSGTTGYPVTDPGAEKDLPSGVSRALERHVIQTMFATVESMKRSHTWAQVETLVELQHKTLISLNDKWQ